MATTRSPPLRTQTSFLPPFPSFAYTTSVRHRSNALQKDTSGEDRDREQDGLETEGGNSKQRYRQIQSCTECRRRKTKCNKAFPCEPCKSRGPQVAQSCIEYEKEMPSGYIGYTHLSDFDKLVERTRLLEQLLVKTNHHLNSLLGTTTEDPVDLPEFPPFPPQSSLQPYHRVSWQDDGDQGYTNDVLENFPKGASPRDTAQARQPGHFYHSQPPSKAPSLADHNAALLLEDIALNRSSNVQRETMPEPNTNTVDPASTFQEPHPSWERQSTSVTICIPDLDILPSKDTMSKLLNIFVTQYEWTFRCMHVPTFQQDNTVFLAMPLFNPLSLKEAAHTILVTACLCTTLHLIDDSPTLLALGYTESSRAATTRALSNLVEMGLMRSDWLQNHRIEWLQAFIIIGPYWHAIGRSEAHWTMLGSVIKIAHGLGLSHVFPELAATATAGEVRRHYGPRWSNAADREVARRVWYTLVDLDWTSCAEHHFTYITPAELHNVSEPANIEDEDLHGYGPILAQPIHIRTRMSFFLARLSLVHPLQTMNKKVIARVRLNYDLLMECHHDTLKAMHAWPDYYQPTVNPEFHTPDAASWSQLVAERALLHFEGETRLLRLHRIYLPNAFSSSRYALSRKTCATEASKMLLATDETLALLSRRLWTWRHGVLSATIVLLCIFFHAKEDSESKQLESLVRGGIEDLRSQADSIALSRSADSLEALLDDEIGWRSKQGAKKSTSVRSGGKKRLRDVRGDEEDSDAHRLVKRVMSATGHAPRGGDSSDTSPSIRTDVGSGGGLLGIDQPDTINPFADFDVSGMEFIGDQGMLDGGWADPWLVELLRGSMTAGGM